MLSGPIAQDIQQEKHKSGTETVLQLAAKESGPPSDSKAEQGSSVSGNHTDVTQRF